VTLTLRQTGHSFGIDKDRLTTTSAESGRSAERGPESLRWFSSRSSNPVFVLCDIAKIILHPVGVPTNS
jgi:hypothetical protein